MFDVDGCLVDSLTGTSLRPGTVDLLTLLRHRRCTTVLWSAGGAEYAASRAKQLGVTSLFDAFHAKDGRGADGRYLVNHLAFNAAVVFVDDRPEDMPEDADVVAVTPYLAQNPHDRGLRAAADRARLPGSEG